MKKLLLRGALSLTAASGILLYSTIVDAAPNKRMPGHKDFSGIANDGTSLPRARHDNGTNWAWIDLGYDVDDTRHYIKIGVEDKDGHTTFEWRFNKERQVEKGWYSCDTAEVAFDGDEHWSLIPKGSMLEEGYKEACH